MKVFLHRRQQSLHARSLMELWYQVTGVRSLIQCSCYFLCFLALVDMLNGEESKINNVATKEFDDFWYGTTGAA